MRREQTTVVNLVHRRCMHDTVRDERSDETNVVHMPSDIREQFRDRQSALAVASKLPRRTQDRIGAVRELTSNRAEALRERLPVALVEQRLGVKGVHRAGCADIEYEDHSVGCGIEMRLLGAERIYR